MAKIIRAVAGILKKNNQVFMASRPLGKVHALSWEFPGGKLEAGEGAIDALIRELKEEIGVEVQAADCVPLTFITQSYDHGDVELDVVCVTKWSGEPIAKEGQDVHWQDLTVSCQKSPLLVTTQKILDILVNQQFK